ncbi:hypothetical protein BKA70DRAFT_1341904 [Coprinopsis sp. MPI-PUGE-AT-0042]|nr:hypothetical protein BKA70DRAFT_1341904 [Coprinopsis sp. MPI-PUGE-AT-0042]
MDASQMSVILLDRPSTLEHYFSTNDVPSPSDFLALDGYLARLSERIKNLESDNSRPHAVDDAKNAEEEHLRREYELCVTVRSPIRKIPQEILGAIFAFAIGVAPFNRFINVVHLRGVCSSWRQAALSTPGIWTDLTVDLDKWCDPDTPNLDQTMLFRRFEDELKPWLAILSRTPAYHLTLTSGASLDRVYEDLQSQLTQYLLSTTPQPGTITLESPAGVLGIMSLASLGLKCPSLKLIISGDRMPDLKTVASVFPSLEALEVRAPLILNATAPLCHSSLQTLHLDNLGGPGAHLHRLIQELPSLRELNLSSFKYMDITEFHTPPATYTHHSLETLILNGEDFLYLLRRISFPCLRLLAVYGHQYSASGFDDEMRQTKIFTHIFSRSSTEPLLVSLRGDFRSLFLSKLIQSLPSHCHLLVDIDNEGGREDVPITSDNIEAIFCGRGAVDLSWLSSAGRAIEHSSRTLKIYLPTDFVKWVIGYIRRNELRRHGFELETLSNDSARSMLRSLAPVFSKHSAGWWECELV